MPMDLGSIVRKAAKPIAIAGASAYLILNLVGCNGNATPTPNHTQNQSPKPSPTETYKPEPIASPQYTNNPALQPTPTPVYTPTPSPELVSELIPTPAIAPQPLRKNKIGFDEVPFGWPAPLFVTDQKDNLESKVEFEFGSDVYLNLSISEKVSLTDDLGLYRVIIDYTPPNGSKITLKDELNIIYDTRGKIKFNSDIFNLREYLGTLEAGQHIFEAKLITPPLEPKTPPFEPKITTTEAVSFKILEPPIITVDDTLTQKPVYATEEWDYFQEIAFGSEYGSNGKTIAKWHKQNPPIIFVHGSAIDGNIKPSQGSMDALKEVVEELKGLTNLDIQFTDEPSKANFRVYLDVLHSDLYKIFPNLSTTIIDNNVGFFYFEFDGNSNIYQAISAVSRESPRNNEILPRKTIDKLIREEVTQALGLANDSDKYKWSIFQQNKWIMSKQNNSFYNLHFLPIDRRIIRLLYQPEVKPYMSISQVKEVIEVIK